MYLIYNVKKNAFWNRDAGWVEINKASIFEEEEKEKYFVPHGGEKVQNVTYRELIKEILSKVNNLDDNVSVYTKDDEFVNLWSTLGRSDTNDPADGILDKGHAYLIMSDVPKQ